MLWLLFIINVTIVAIITVTMMLLVFDICSWSPTHRRPWCFKHFLAIFCFFMVFHVNLHTHVMLRYCYVLLHLHTHVMLRYGYLGVGLGGVGWGNDVHVNLHTHVMLRYGFFSLALAHTRHATLWLSWGGVGWGNDVHVNLHTHVMLRYCYVLLHLHTHVMLRYGYFLLHLLTHVMLRYGYLGVGLGGVGQWRSCQLAHTRHATLLLCSLAQKNTLNWKSLSWVTVGENLWDHWHLTDFSKNFARPSKQWSASEKKEKSAASQKSTNFCQKTK